MDRFHQIRSTVSGVIEWIQPGGELAERTVKSGLWATILKSVDRVLQLGKLVVLARLLTPADFGLMGIALLTLAVFKRFSKLGISEALIHHRDEDVDRYLNTAWVISTLRGVVIVGIAFPLAPYIADFFHEPRSVNIIRVIVLTVLITGLCNPGVIYFRKNLEFDKLFVYVSSATIINVTVAIGYALVYRNVWALVFGEIAGNLTYLIVSYVIHGYRPSFEFDLEFAKELFGYGKWIMGSGILIFLYSQGDDIFVGWLLSAAALGYYRVAYRFSNAPASELAKIISEVAFPMYSKIQGNQRRLREAYVQVLNVTLAVSFPAAIGIAIISPFFVKLFLGANWIPIVVTMQILAGWGFVNSFIATTTPLFDAIGVPDYSTKLRLLALALIAVFIYPATSRWGIDGTAVVIFGSGMIVSVLTIYIAANTIDLDVGPILGVIGYPALASGVMGGLLVVLRVYVVQVDYAGMVLIIGTGVVTYTLAIVGLDRWTGYELRDTIKLIYQSFA